MENNNQDPGLDSQPGAYFAHEKDRQRMNRLPPRIDAKMKLFDRNRPMQKNLQNSNLFIGHSVKRSFEVL